MGLYNFMPKFEPLILDGTKRYTIRGRRRVEDVPGNPMHLYVYLRSPQARRIAVVPCIRVGLVEMPNSARDQHRQCAAVELRDATAGEGRWLSALRATGGVLRGPDAVRRKDLSLETTRGGR